MTERVIVDTQAGVQPVVGRVFRAVTIASAGSAVVGPRRRCRPRPESGGAAGRAHLGGTAARPRDHIAELSVHDSQQLNKGDLLFVIDRRPYEIALERARATLALTRSEVDGLKNGAATAAAGVAKAQAQLGASAAEVTRLETQFRNAD